ncbi:MAG TPA: alcohol dehydrogenase catalytic domain-containing protein [Gaiellaceae bacterium]|nr:alcohol dehydrogenase catalytic domain-containing protein [Gaiellaceae bacterium]
MTRGVVYAEPDAAPAVEELTVDPPGPREVLVRVQACGLCHSDLHIVETKGWGSRFPILLGHEGAGIVEEVGSDVSMVAPGDRVVIAWRAPCGDCPQCKRGDPRRCSSQLRAKRRLHRAVDGALLTPVLRCGTFANHAVVHEAVAVKIPEELPIEQATLLACGFSTGAGAALWATPVREGASVAVVGCGGVGLSVIQGALLRDAGQIIAVDVAPEKLEHALALGATDVVDASTADPVEAVRELTGGRGVEFAFFAGGGPPALAQTVRMLAYAGWATIVGLVPPNSKLKVDLDTEFFGPRITLTTTHGGDTIPREDFPFLAQAALDGRIDLARFVSSTISLDEVPERLPRIGERGEIRTVALF